MTDEPNVTRRRFLSLVGAGGGVVGLAGCNEKAERSYSRTVNVSRAGAEPTGITPINDVLERVVADDTLVVFPPGTYLLDRRFSLEDARNVGLVGTGGSGRTTLLVRGDFADEQLFDFGRSSNDAAEGIEFRGFTVDFTAPGAGAGVFWAYCKDNARIEDIVVDGYIEGPHPQGFGEIFIRLDITDPDGSGLLKDVKVKDGARYVGSGATAAGIYVGGAHAGHVTIQDCEITNFHDNGLYTSAAAQSGGSVTIRGGHYSNCDVASVRVGGAETLVENVTIVQDSVDMLPGDNPRGLYGRNGNATIRDVDIHYTEGAAEALQLGVQMESFALENVRVHQTTGTTPCWIKDSVGVDESFRIDGLTVVTEGDGDPLLTCYGDWEGTVTGSCFRTTNATSRDGLVFESGEASVTDSTVNVAGTAVEGASTSNVSREGTCGGSRWWDVVPGRTRPGVRRT